MSQSSMLLSLTHKSLDVILFIDNEHKKHQCADVQRILGLFTFIFSFQLGIDFFPLFGGSRVEKTGKEDPVACFRVLKLLII